MTKKLHRLEISRKKWINGSNCLMSCENSTFGYTSLINEKNKMCCLGFYGLSCGVPGKVLKLRQDPINVISSIGFTKTKFDELVNSRGIKNSRICNKLIDINDNPDITNESRENLLKKKFREIGVLVKFVD